MGMSRCLIYSVMLLCLTVQVYLIGEHIVPFYAVLEEYTDFYVMYKVCKPYRIASLLN